ncbi:MAG: hypothetical protein RQ833_02275 [Sphingomonadaceae bacterium]|nr:hypothetical protein [Sphingomonadaceae bacterium]
MRRIAVLALLVLSACGDFGSQKELEQAATQGQAARKAMNAAIKVYGDCVFAAARARPAAEPLGPAAQAAVEACPAQRAALKATVVDFTKLGRQVCGPGQDPRKDRCVNEYQIGLLADASLKQFENDVREQAAIEILNHRDTGVSPKKTT